MSSMQRHIEIIRSMRSRQGRSASPAPIPRADWPILARTIARLAQPGERGVGDTIAARLGAGGEWFKSAFVTLTGRDCGCNSRQAHANALYPYE